ncbi:MAG: site-specific DNA-methyltransferase [Candidatus Methanomethyliaceae archaeon]
MEKKVDWLHREAKAPAWWTDHYVYFGDARKITFIPDSSVDLIVTSPPYPMIEMWDDTFAILNSAIADTIAAADGPAAFEMMHQELDKVWRHCLRILKPGGIACINIGDAVRTLKGDFRIYPNHARILSAMQLLGFHALPDILWRKPTNAPNKFMGSGMLPAGAYVTYEHEYILIFRKGSKRQFKTKEEKERRRASAFFWEERNVWFSDIWADLKGTDQELSAYTGRARSGAFPFELPYRLICMYSVYGDVVFDPFLGSGTTTAAAIAACRHSIGIEYFDSLAPVILQNIRQALFLGQTRIAERYKNHLDFIERRIQTGYRLKHVNCVYHLPVMTAQEKELVLYIPTKIEEVSDRHFRVKAEFFNHQDIQNEIQRCLFEKNRLIRC